MPSSMPYRTGFPVLSGCEETRNSPSGTSEEPVTGQRSTASKSGDMELMIQDYRGHGYRQNRFWGSWPSRLDYCSRRIRR